VDSTRAVHRSGGEQPSLEVAKSHRRVVVPSGFVTIDPGMEKVRRTFLSGMQACERTVRVGHLSRSLFGLAALSGLGCGAMASQASAASTNISPPGCSTAVASAPALSNVATVFSTDAWLPFGVAISADSKTAFVADASGAIVLYPLASSTLTGGRVDSFRVNGKADQLGSAVSGISPLGLALTPNGRYLVAAAGVRVVVFSTAALKRKGSDLSAWRTGTWTNSGQGAIEAAVSPDGDYAFVTLEDSDTLAVLDLKAALRAGFDRSDLIGTVPLGVAPVGIAIAPDGKYLYVTSEATTTNQNLGTLTTIDVAMAERKPSQAVLTTVPAGCSPVRVAATRTSVYVTARGSDAVLAFNAHDLVDQPQSALEAQVQVGEAPVGLALIDHNETIVVADSDRFSAPGAGASLAVVKVGGANHMLLAGYVPTGSFPRDIAASPNGARLIVSDFGSGQVEAIKTNTLP
jgi:DNA-binding beta-propeller fold protein YncE